ncbi:MAG TPA: NADPH:quinone oxidoreductase family protein [Candidatus Binataceae bacterium]|nr:NADPH:quinone oxidoreductase family protein [Candidatus Binataceae bacterium]
MKALICRNLGGLQDLELADVPSPPLGPGQVRIRVRACGLNFADSLMIEGKYQVKPPLPFTPGMECAGEIAEVGSNVSGLNRGQRVMAFTRAGGSYAEEVVVTSGLVWPIPDRMDFLTAAGFPVVYGTSHYALTYRGSLKAGETLLVTGAAGGVGLTAVEIGNQLGARVIGAAGSGDKCAVAREHGAHETIDYSRESIRDRVRELTDGKGADVVYDPVGGDAFDQALRAVNWEARMLVVGFASGRVQNVPANLVLVKNVSVIGVVWGAQSERDPGLVSSGMLEMLRWWEAGRLRPKIAATFTLGQASEALQALLSRRYAGKLVMTL